MPPAAASPAGAACAAGAPAGGSPPLHGEGIPREGIPAKGYRRRKGSVTEEAAWRSEAVASSEAWCRARRCVGGVGGVRGGATGLARAVRTPASDRRKAEGKAEGKGREGKGEARAAVSTRKGGGASGGAPRGLRRRSAEPPAALRGFLPARPAPSDLRPPAKGKARARPTEGKGARAARARERRQQLHLVVDVREGWVPFGKFGLGADLRHDGKRKRGIEWVRRGMNRRAGGEGTRSREKVGRAARTGASACGAEACTSRESKSGDSGERWLGSATRCSGALFGILILVDEGAWPGQASSRLCVRRKRLAIRAGGARQAEASREHAHVNAARRHRSRRKSWGGCAPRLFFPFR